MNVKAFPRRRVLSALHGLCAAAAVTWSVASCISQVVMTVFLLGLPALILGALLWHFLLTAGAPSLVAIGLGAVPFVWSTLFTMLAILMAGGRP